MRAQDGRPAQRRPAADRLVGMRFPIRVAAPLVLALFAIAGCVDIDSLVSHAPAGSANTGPTPVGTPVLTAPVPTPEPTFLIYKVKPNDRLASIAKKYKTTVESIGFWNRARYGTLDPQSSIYAPDSIKVGWLLRIHPGQTTDADYEDPVPSPTDEPSSDGSPSPSPSA
jgi:LysM domain